MRSQTFSKFAKLVMNNEISLMPWQEDLLKAVTKGRRFFYRPARHHGNAQLRWLIMLMALRENWEAGRSTTMFSLQRCDLRKTELIFDEFIIIDKG